jgi:endonuclease YncB( thermonuclease family)
MMFVCLVAAVVDADTLRCDDGQRLRIAGISARERDGSCNSPVCPAMRHRQARPLVESLVLRRRLTCRSVGQSYGRVVASCELPAGGSLSCAVIASGAAVRWDRYWRGPRCRT